MTLCGYCFGPLSEKSSGRTSVFCCNACKQAHYRLTKPGVHRTAEENRKQARLRSIQNELNLKSLRNVGGTDLNQGKPLRNVGASELIN